MRKSFSVVLFVGLALWVGCARESSETYEPPDPKKIELQQLRNLGKAFYENPATQNRAPEVLSKALDLNPGSAQEHLNLGLALLRAGQMPEGIAQVEKAQEIDPALPHTYFNLGIEFKKQGETDRALAQLERMAERVPDHAKTHYQLGSLYKQKGDTERAIAELEKAVELDPSLAAPHFQLFGLMRRSDPDRALKEIEVFKSLKAAQEGAAVGEDVDWSVYSELYDPVQQATHPLPGGDVKFESEPIGVELAGSATGIEILDSNADGNADLLVWSKDSASLLTKDGASWKSSALVVPPGLSGLRTFVVGDVNNDGFPDIAAVHGGGVQLLTNQTGTFDTGKELLKGDYRDALWVDFDHDYDLDLVAVGTNQSLLRNNGDGTFADVSGSFPFRTGKVAQAVAFLEMEEDNGNDILVAYADELVVFEDRKLGRFDPRTVAGLSPGSGVASLEIADLDNDGFLDAILNSSGAPDPHSQVLENNAGVFERGMRLPRALAWADTQNRGWLDGLTAEGVMLNEGGFQFGTAKGLSGNGPSGNFAAAVAADFDGDARTDFATVSSDGSIAIQWNRAENRNQGVTISLEGVKNQKLAEGARVEVKAGLNYGKQVYKGVPLMFGVGASQTIDTVRITWPNGLIQNESEQPAGQKLSYIEKPRLSGSCPMIFTWNGKEFEFISDVLGVAPLGAGLGDGQFFPTDHDEYVWVPAESLKPRNGFYEVRVTEELREVSYLDQIELLVVDHPEKVEIFTNEKFISPPFPEFRLFGVEERIYPSSATSSTGRDVLRQLTRRDRVYAEGFEWDFAGRAETHTLTLDLSGLRGRDDAVLFLHGWVDWADGSTFVGTAQSKRNVLLPPRLEVRGRDGEWVTALEDMGIPAGKPKTIAVDLKGVFRSDSREVRIVTNLCVYWDEIFAAGNTADPEARLTRLRAADATLDFRGFSRVEIHPERRQPEHFVYSEVQSSSMWNPTPGEYTNYGDVNELLADIDDRFVVMGSGDEVKLRFPAAGLPELPAGWRRDYLLFFDGWAKDGDSNTAFSSSVEPLPFHGMSGYPYGPDERYPDDALHRDYLRDFNRRPALRLIQPLARR
ncbi:MAG: FG-GAP-like repeat-containing protein [Acidobacteria bacterium]|nr:FG-GAP-like repeat-containing protein [Acidobacteriota bacterium]